jgi:hypothetical protein
MTPVYKPGRYSCRITDQYFGKSQNTGTLKFCLVVLIVENLDDPDNPCRQMTREVNQWLSRRTLDRVMRDLRSLGYDGADLSGLDPDKHGFHDFRGQETEVLCEHEQDLDGNLWERWKLCGPPRKLQDKSQLRELDRLLRGNAVADTDHDRADVSDEEVPF